MLGVQHAGLPLKMDGRTEGDGNCFPRAVKQQCERSMVAINTIRDHKDLRTKVCRFMVQQDIEVVQDMKIRWEALEVMEPWDQYWRRMSVDREWAEDIFIQGTAWFLERDILIIWDSATPEDPFITISGNRDGSNSRCPGSPLLLGYLRGLHYQSLLPQGEEIYRPAVFNPRIPEEIIQCQMNQKSTRGENEDDMTQILDDGEDNENQEVVQIKQFKSGVAEVEVKKKKNGHHEYRCLFCYTIQKQILSHMRKQHPDKFDDQEQEEFKKWWTKLANQLAVARCQLKRRTEDNDAVKKDQRVRVSRHHARRREEDLEGVRKDQRERESRHLAKRRREDLEGVREDQRERKSRHLANKRQEDLEGVREDQREWKSRHLARRRKEDQDRVKGDQREWVKKFRSKDEDRFNSAMKFGPIFPCSCCHTLCFRDQVVEFSTKVQQKIREKAEEAHQRSQVSMNINDPDFLKDFSIFHKSHILSICEILENIM